MASKTWGGLTDERLGKLFDRINQGAALQEGQDDQFSAQDISMGMVTQDFLNSLQRKKQTFGGDLDTRDKEDPQKMGFSVRSGQTGVGADSFKNTEKQTKGILEEAFQKARDMDTGLQLGQTLTADGSYTKFTDYVDAAAEAVETGVATPQGKLANIYKMLQDGGEGNAIPAAQAPALDINGDGFITPADALYLQNEGVGQEGQASWLSYLYGDNPLDQEYLIAREEGEQPAYDEFIRDQYPELAAKEVPEDLRKYFGGPTSDEQRELTFGAAAGGRFGTSFDSNRLMFTAMPSFPGMLDMNMGIVSQQIQQQAAAAIEAFKSPEMLSVFDDMQRFGLTPEHIQAITSLSPEDIGLTMTAQDSNTLMTYIKSIEDIYGEGYWGTLDASELLRDISPKFSASFRIPEVTLQFLELVEGGNPSNQADWRRRSFSTSVITLPLIDAQTQVTNNLTSPENTQQFVDWFKKVYGGGDIAARSGEIQQPSPEQFTTTTSFSPTGEGVTDPVTDPVEGGGVDTIQPWTGYNSGIFAGYNEHDQPINSLGIMLFDLSENNTWDGTPWDGEWTAGRSDADQWASPGPNDMTTQAIVEWVNPETGEMTSNSTGGWAPPPNSGWMKRHAYEMYTGTQLPSSIELHFPDGVPDREDGADVITDFLDQYFPDYDYSGSPFIDEDGLEYKQWPTQAHIYSGQPVFDPLNMHGYNAYTDPLMNHSLYMNTANPFDSTFNANYDMMQDDFMVDALNSFLDRRINTGNIFRTIPGWEQGDDWIRPRHMIGFEEQDWQNMLPGVVDYGLAHNQNIYNNMQTNFMGYQKDAYGRDIPIYKHKAWNPANMDVLGNLERSIRMGTGLDQMPIDKAAYEEEKTPRFMEGGSQGASAYPDSHAPDEENPRPNWISDDEWEYARYLIDTGQLQDEGMFLYEPEFSKWRQSTNPNRDQRIVQTQTPHVWHWRGGNEFQKVFLRLGNGFEKDEWDDFLKDRNIQSGVVTRQNNTTVLPDGKDLSGKSPEQRDWSEVVNYEHYLGTNYTQDPLHKYLEENPRINVNDINAQQMRLSSIGPRIKELREYIHAINQAMQFGGDPNWTTAQQAEFNRKLWQELQPFKYEYNKLINEQALLSPAGRGQLVEGWYGPGLWDESLTPVHTAIQDYYAGDSVWLPR